MAKCRNCDEPAVFGNAICRTCMEKLSWLDRQFSANLVWLVILPLFCNLLALPMSIAGSIGCKEPVAKGNARIMLVISVLMLLVALAIGLSKQR